MQRLSRRRANATTCPPARVSALRSSCRARRRPRVAHAGPRPTTQRCGPLPDCAWLRVRLGLLGRGGPSIAWRDTGPGARLPRHRWAGTLASETLAFSQR
jgi:hypothetical protein